MVAEFRGRFAVNKQADCGTDHCLVVAKVRERLAAQKFRVERFNLGKLNELEVIGEPKR
jgi:hypothetical protein